MNCINIKNQIYSHCYAFKPQTTPELHLILLSDDNSNLLDLYSDDTFLVRDLKEFQKKDYYRQIFLQSNLNDILCEMTIYHIPKSEAKATNNIVIKNNKMKENQKQKTCLDSENISSHIIKAILSGLHFLNNSTFPNNKYNILILGNKSCGIISHFLNKFFKGKINITTVEKNESYKKMGSTYFGFADNNSKHITLSPQEFVLAEVKTNNLYDYIIIDDSNLSPNASISPGEAYFEEDFLSLVKVNTI